MRRCGARCGCGYCGRLTISCLSFLCWLESSFRSSLARHSSGSWNPAFDVAFCLALRAKASAVLRPAGIFLLIGNKSPKNDFVVLCSHASAEDHIPVPAADGRASMRALERHNNLEKALALLSLTALALVQCKVSRLFIP